MRVGVSTRLWRRLSVLSNGHTHQLIKLTEQTSCDSGLRAGAQRQRRWQQHRRSRSRMPRLCQRFMTVVPTGRREKRLRLIAGRCGRLTSCIENTQEQFSLPLPAVLLLVFTSTFEVRATRSLLYIPSHATIRFLERPRCTKESHLAKLTRHHVKIGGAACLDASSVACDIRSPSCVCTSMICWCMRIVDKWKRSSSSSLQYGCTF